MANLDQNVARRVLTHRRYPDAIFEVNVAQIKLREQPFKSGHEIAEVILNEQGLQRLPYCL